MIDFKKEHAPDKSKLEGGVWVEVSGARFLLASMNSQRYDAAVNLYSKEHTYELQRGEIDPAVAKELDLKSFATLIRDWEKVGWNGKLVECNHTNALQLLKNCPDVTKQLRIKAAKTSLYMPSAADVGNSKAS